MFYIKYYYIYTVYNVRKNYFYFNDGSPLPEKNRTLWSNLIARFGHCIVKSVRNEYFYRDNFDARFVIMKHTIYICNNFQLKKLLQFLISTCRFLNYEKTFIMEIIYLSIHYKPSREYV